MQVTVASNFNEYVAAMAANSPHGLMMDLWRRLDLAVGEYLDSSGSTVNRRNRSAIEETLALDRAFGSRFADSLRRLRVLRNGVAHQPVYHHSSEDAIGYGLQRFETADPNHFHNLLLLNLCFSAQRPIRPSSLSALGKSGARQ